MKITRALLVPLSMLCVQCGASQASEPGSRTPASEEMRPAALVAPPILRAEPPDGETNSTPLNDAQTAAVLSAIIQSQIAQANVAGPRANSDRVAKLAAVIITRRTNVQRELDNYIAALPHGAEDSTLRRRVQADAQGVTDTMTRLNGIGFDAAYVGGQIREFEHALEILDTRVIPVTHSVELQRIASELQNALVQNLAAARALQRELVHNAGQ